MSSSGSLGEVVGGRAWLNEVADLVSSDEEWRQGKPRSHHNVAVTCAGLRALGVPEAMIATFSDEFQQGMAGAERDARRPRRERA